MLYDFVYKGVEMLKKFMIFVAVFALNFSTANSASNEADAGSKASKINSRNAAGKIKVGVGAGLGISRTKSTFVGHSGSAVVSSLLRPGEYTSRLLKGFAAFGAKNKTRAIPMLELVLLYNITSNTDFGFKYEANFVSMKPKLKTTTPVEEVIAETAPAEDIIAFSAAHNALLETPLTRADNFRGLNIIAVSKNDPDAKEINPKARFAHKFFVEFGYRVHPACRIFIDLGVVSQSFKTMGKSKRATGFVANLGGEYAFNDNISALLFINYQNTTKKVEGCKAKLRGFGVYAAVRCYAIN